ncbi:hypothetical protein H5410_053871, partial [Solanum commersonii]
MENEKKPDKLHRNLLSGSCGFEPRYFRGLSTPFSLSLTRLASCFNLQNQCFDDDGEGDGCDYGYSRLIVFLEKLSTPLRLWIGGYALQCLLHVCFIWVEFQRSFDDFAGGNFDGVSSFSLLHSSKILVCLWGLDWDGNQSILRFHQSGGYLAFTGLLWVARNFCKIHLVFTDLIGQYIGQGAASASAVVLSDAVFDIEAMSQ